MAAKRVEMIAPILRFNQVLGMNLIYWQECECRQYLDICEWFVLFLSTVEFHCGYILYNACEKKF